MCVPFPMREVQQADNFLDAVAKARRLFVRESPNQASSLTCVMEECGWSEVRFGRDAIENWAVPWTYATTGPFDQS